jgi:hypothetical protein
MKSIKRRDINGAQAPYTRRPRKKYSFRTPIPPCSVVRVKAAPRNPWRKDVGRRFRIGYYSRKDGLDCIWLVNNHGKYEQTLDHDYLYKFFEVESVSKERSLYGRNRQSFEPMK